MKIKDELKEIDIKNQKILKILKIKIAIILMIYWQLGILILGIPY